MTCSLETVLADAKMLVSRLKDHENSTENVISQATSLHKRVDSMRTYQEDLNALNEMARHRPRANLIMGLVQENSQIRELQNENKELRLSLEEHQSALELIMTKYRDQMEKLMLARRLEERIVEKQNQAQMIEAKLDKINEMASVMKKAIVIDEEGYNSEQRLIARLQMENKSLRELLDSSVLWKRETGEAGTQTDDGDELDSKSHNPFYDSDNDVMNSSVIEVKSADNSGLSDSANSALSDGSSVIDTSTIKRSPRSNKTETVIQDSEALPEKTNSPSTSPGPSASPNKPSGPNSSPRIEENSPKNSPPQKSQSQSKSSVPKFVDDLFGKPSAKEEPSATPEFVDDLFGDLDDYDAPPKNSPPKKTIVNSKSPKNSPPRSASPKTPVKKSPPKAKVTTPKFVDALFGNPSGEKKSPKTSPRETNSTKETPASNHEVSVSDITLDVHNDAPTKDSHINSEDSNHTEIIIANSIPSEDKVIGAKDNDNDLGSNQPNKAPVSCVQDENANSSQSNASKIIEGNCT